jgi:hypothetical protein
LLLNLPELCTFGHPAILVRLAKQHVQTPVLRTRHSTEYLRCSTYLYVLHSYPPLTRPWQDTLDWACSCSLPPSINITDYGHTIPSLECQEWIPQCLDAHPNDAVAQESCRAVTCGSENPEAYASAALASVLATQTTSSSTLSSTFSVIIATATSRYDYV